LIDEAAAPRAAAAVSGALRFERDAGEYYRAASRRAVDPFAGQLFEMFAEMAERRVDEIVALAAKLEAQGNFPESSTAPSEARMRQFRAEHDRIADGARIAESGVAVIRKALALGAEGREMYTRLSLKAHNPIEKEFFRRLAEEESAILETIFGYLDGVEAQIPD
jgi:rubrerythrin